jgi:Tol biopolymer transport system component
MLGAMNAGTRTLLRSILLALPLLLAGACASTEVVTPAVEVEFVTATFAPEAVPSATSTSTATPAPTINPSPEPSPDPPSATPEPSQTPWPSVGIAFDRWERIDIPAALRDGTSAPYLVFTNANNRTSIANIATAEASNNTLIAYVAPASSPGSRIELLTLDVTTGDQVFPDPNGRVLMYFRGGAPGVAGLYLLNLANGLNARSLALNGLVQRGIYTPPSISPRGDQYAIALETGYDLDVFVVNADGSGMVNISDHGAFDFWPVWSPDGRYIAFVSDRETCASWRPGAGSTCNPDTNAYPTGGQVYVWDMLNANLTQVGDLWVSEPPRWINARFLALVEGDPDALVQTQRRLWRGEVPSGQAIPVRALAGNDANDLAEAWSSDGNRVLVQHAAGSQLRLDIIDLTTGEVTSRDELAFPRYGLAADWTNDGTRLAIGGLNDQCPYGVRVYDAAFAGVASGGPPPTVCNPTYSPDSQYLAFTGINPGVDGRKDVYIANANGFGATSLTSALQGQNQLIGWLGPVRN